MINTDKKIESVDVGSVDRLARILGAFDENLNFLSRELGVLAYVDGVKIRVEGESKAVSLATRVLKEIVKLTENGEEIDKGRMATTPPERAAISSDLPSLASSIQ